MLYHTIREKTPIFLFGHRGAPRISHENSIQSISESINLGCHGIEVDIQITKDNKIILFHDDFIVFNNQQHLIRNNSYKKISEFCIETKRPKPDLFEDLISLIHKHPQIVFNIEIKSRLLNNYKILRHILNQLPKETLHNQCIISSFNYCLLYQLHFFLSYKGPIALILASEHLKGKLSLKTNKAIITILKPQFLHININNTTKSLVEWAHKQFMIINTYTVNDKDTLIKCISMGIDGVFTDNHNLYLK